jgi:hypothetical protein
MQATLILPKGGLSRQTFPVFHYSHLIKNADSADLGK